jgi:hypothetical protein
MSQRQSGVPNSGVSNSGDPNIARWEQLIPDFEYSHQATGEPSLSRRHAASSLPAVSRARSQEEVVTGLSPQEALEECRRCLRCDLRGTPGAG